MSGLVSVLQQIRRQLKVRLGPKSVLCHSSVTIAKFNNKFTNPIKLNFSLGAVNASPDVEFSSPLFNLVRSAELAEQTYFAHGMQEVRGSTPLGSTKSFLVFMTCFEWVTRYSATIGIRCHSFACSLRSLFCHSNWVTIRDFPRFTAGLACPASLATSPTSTPCARSVLTKLWRAEWWVT